MNLQEELKVLKKRIAELEEQAKEEQEFPQEGDSFYSISETGNIEGGMIWGGYPVDMNRMAIGNVFRAEEQAEFAVEKLKVEAELRKFSKPFEDDISDWYIFYDTESQRIYTDSRMYCQTQGAIYFESEQVAQQAIELVGEERIKKYLF